MLYYKNILIQKHLNLFINFISNIFIVNLQLIQDFVSHFIRLFDR